MTSSFQEWALTMGNSDGLKQEDMVDFIEKEVWSLSYLNLGYFVFFSKFCKGTGFLLIVEMFITIAGVQCLYLRLDYESWSNKTGYKTWKRKQNILN